MKKQIVLSSICLSVVLLLSGCVAIGNDVPKNSGGTLGQQLIDLKTAHSMGALTDAEYESLRSKLVGKK